MATRVMTPLEVAPGPWRGRRLPTLVRWLVTLGLLGLLALLLYWTQGEERRTLRAMVPAERAELFERDFATFTSMCLGAPEPALLADCRARARFLGLFPECDASCRRALERYQPRLR